MKTHKTREGLTSVQIRPQILQMMAPFTKKGQSKTDLINEALRQYLLEKEFEEVRQSLVPLAQSKGIYTDEDAERMLR
ncbi:MAG: hypothetical protein HY593_03440 [Candidatus Omnitrophica bacterium]|nr:hypothetical protein [Candidatus Omnitrophota bacterium]